MLNLFLKELIALGELVQLIPLLLVVELHLLNGALHVLDLAEKGFFVRLGLLGGLRKNVHLLLDLGELALLLLDVGLYFPLELSVSELVLLDLLLLRLHTYLVQLLLFEYLFRIGLQAIFEIINLLLLVLNCLRFCWILRLIFAIAVVLTRGFLSLIMGLHFLGDLYLELLLESLDLLAELLDLCLFLLILCDHDIYFRLLILQRLDLVLLLLALVRVLLVIVRRLLLFKDNLVLV